MSASDAAERQAPLKEASLQAIHMELIRRVDNIGEEKVAVSLERHADRWLSAWMTNSGSLYPDDQGRFNLCLLPLRDLPRNDWNVDTLLLLTDNVDKAQRLVDIAEEEDWQTDAVFIQESEETAAGLGLFPCPFHVVRAWWD